MSELTRQIKIRDDTYHEIKTRSSSMDDTFDSIIRKFMEAYDRELARAAGEGGKGKARKGKGESNSNLNAE